MSVSIFGAASESIVFAYIGLCVFTYAADAKVGDLDQHTWSVSFIGWMTLIVILGRLLAVWTAHGLLSMCQKTQDITLRELCFISYGGMIRGAIAFGLVLKIPNDPQFKERGVIITTTLALVIITTLFFGTFMAFAQKIMLPPLQGCEEDIMNLKESNHDEF